MSPFAGLTVPRVPRGLLSTPEVVGSSSPNPWRDLGLRWGATTHEEDTELATAEVPPKAFVGEFPLDLNPKRVLIVIGPDNILPKAAPGYAEGMFPGHLLARYHVVFDYPKSTFTLARPGALTPKGDELPMPVSKPSGFPRTEIEVAGVRHGFLIDTGASFTMVSEVLLKAWGRDSLEQWARPRPLAARPSRPCLCLAGIGERTN
jgi:hypothetical protein